MSTVAEIQDAIRKLNEQDRYSLLAQLFATVREPEEGDPELLAAFDRGMADDEADQIHSIEDVRRMIPQWISESRSQRAP